jgi:hypothetical protein
MNSGENFRLADDAARHVDPAVISQRQRALVENSEQQLPEGVVGLLDLIEENETHLQLVGVVLFDRLLRQQRGRLVVPQITRGRSDQLGDLVAVLKLRAIDLNERARVPEQDLGRSLYHAGFSRSRRSKEQQISDRPSGHRHARQVDLIHVHDAPDRAILPHNLGKQSALEIENFRAPHLRIQENIFRNQRLRHGSVPPCRTFRLTDAFNELAVIGRSGAG